MSSINILTDLAGKVRNMPHFYNKNALLPLFEAIVNSIQSIEDSPNKNKGEVLIRILRDENSELIETDETGGDIDTNGRGVKALPNIVAFEIIDNGLGFNEENYKSFLTSDSTLKLKKGCKGLGRFSWLKAFESVYIESFYAKNDSIFNREFEFNVKDGIKEIHHKEISKISDDCNFSLRTKVLLSGFNEKYRESATAYKKPEKIAQRILEHCLASFISGNNTNIRIEDCDEKISITDLYNELKSTIETEEFSLKGFLFKLHHIKMYNTYQQANNIFYCANARDVLFENIEKKVGVSPSDMFDNCNNKFFYAVYVESKYLDENVSSDRLNFDIPKEKDISMISMNEIEDNVVKFIKEKLSDIIERVNEEKKIKINNYVSKVNPALRSVIKYSPNLLCEMTLNDSDERISEILYKNKSKLEIEIQKKGRELLKTQLDSLSDINEKFGIYEEKLEDVAKDGLASYVLNRKLIIDLFERKLEITNNKYEKECVVHDIIMPQKATTDTLSYADHNLWLIDERLVFHELAHSDNSYNGYSTADSKDRPDLFVLQECDTNNKVAREISIVELKRPERDNINYYEILNQIYGYAKKIRNREIKAQNGRNFLINETTRFFIYFICDFNDDVDEFALNQQFSKLPGDFGYYLYHQNHKLHINLVDYNKILIDVKKRNFAFFEKLGLV